MSEVRIAAEPRTEFGKGAARRIRRDNKVPAVLYGHGTDPRHISLPGHELMLALKTPNVLLTLDLDSGDELALPRDVQRDPIKGFLEHVDLVVVKRGEKVVVEIPVHLVGEAAPETLVNLDLNTLSIEAEATHIPTGVDVSIDGMGVGDQVHASDVKLPEGASLATDPEALVVNITAAPTAEQLEAELAEAEAEVGIVQEPSGEEQAEAAAGEAGEGEPAAEAGEGEKAES
ncbi:MAG TPA: 50S ribosomal protein L25/general stress protein Ctc [Actinomycetes bacterium]|nr:50S ribosomal protein L25/general stress protein Ctc [Actinomycetes bacterium]